MRFLSSALKLILILGNFLVSCTLTTPQTDINVGSVITIVEPVGGAQYQVGSLVKVRALVESADGAKEVDLVINGDIVRRDQLDVPLRKGNLLQPWQPDEPGEYLIQQNMTTDAGNIVQSNAVLITVKGEEQPPTVELQPPTVEVQPTTYVPEPVVTISPTITITLTPSPSITPSWTWYPTDTYTPSPEPLKTPEPIAPSGSYSCRSTIFLEWNSVYSVNGISYYEWVVEGSGATETDTTTDIQAEFFIPGCGATYRWRVRAVDNLGTVGPFSPWIDFTIE